MYSTPFRSLARAAAPRYHGRNVDEIAQSIFSLFAPGRLPVACGFLLADTGVVVTDSTILGDLKVGQEPGAAIWLRPFAGGPELDAVLVVPPKSVLDFAVFKLNQPAARSPLELSLALPALGDPATVCISHGSTQGFHDARVTGVKFTIPIQDPKGPHARHLSPHRAEHARGGGLVRLARGFEGWPRHRCRRCWKRRELRSERPGASAQAGRRRSRSKQWRPAAC